MTEIKKLYNGYYYEGNFCNHVRMTKRFIDIKMELHMKEIS